MIIIFLGPPGAGKGTQAKMLSNNLNIPHLSTGEILRQMIVKNDDLGKSLNKIMTKGLLVSDDMINEIVENRINLDDCKTGFILDGFPRTINQATNLESSLKNQSKKLDKVIQIDVPNEILIKRIMGREVCVDCATIYNKFFDPLPVKGCKKCGSKKKPYVRKDDDEISFKNVRLKKYNEETKPLIDYYQNVNLLKSFDGTEQITEIGKKIIKYLKNI